MHRTVSHLFGALTSDCGAQNGDLCFVRQYVWLMSENWTRTWLRPSLLAAHTDFSPHWRETPPPAKLTHRPPPKSHVTRRCCAWNDSLCRLNKTLVFGEKRWTQLSGTRGPCSTDACVTGRAQVSSTGSPGHRHTGSCGGDDGGASDARKVRRPTTPGQAPAESYPNPTRNTDPEPGRAGLGDPQFWPVFQGLLAYETPENTSQLYSKGPVSQSVTTLRKGRETIRLPKLSLVHLLLCPIPAPRNLQGAPLNAANQPFWGAHGGCVCNGKAPWGVRFNLGRGGGGHM